MQKGEPSSAPFYIPGNFIPAILRAKLGLPICLNIFFIWAYWRSRLLTSCTLVPEPRAMRLRRLPFVASWWVGSYSGLGFMIALPRVVFFSSNFLAGFFGAENT